MCVDDPSFIDALGRHLFCVRTRERMDIKHMEVQSRVEIFWAFSIYLEAVTILPQLVLLQRSGNVDNLTCQYVFFLGAYHAFYITNWIYRYLTEPRFTRWIVACVSGIVQTALYADFFYYYFISWKNN